MSINASLHALATSSSPSEVSHHESLLLTHLQSSPDSHLLHLCEAFTTCHDEGVRLAALLCIKNVVTTRWRLRNGALRRSNSTETNKIQLTDPTKQHLRNMIITSISNADSLPLPIRRSISSITAKIVRHDGIQAFDSLLPSLLPCIQHSSFAIDTLNKIAKELSTQRLLLHKRNFSDLAVSCFPAVMACFKEGCGRVMGDSDLGGDFLGHFSIVVKTLNKLVINTLPSLLEGGDTGILVGDMFGLSLSLMSALSARPLSAALEKVLSRLSQTSLEAHRSHPIHFAPYLPPHLHFFASALQTAAVGHTPPEPFPNPKFITNATNFLSSVSSHPSYSPSQSQNPSMTTSTITAKGSSHLDPKNLSQAISTTQSFFTPQTCTALAEIALTHLMPPTSVDLDDWSDDPESYSSTSSNATADDNPRMSGQQLFVSLIERPDSKALLSGFLTALLRSPGPQLQAADIEANANPNDPISQEVLRWDAIYTAAGVSASVLAEEIDFEAWFESAILPGLTMVMGGRGNPRVPVLLHRLIWLLGCYIQSQTSSLRPKIYQILITVLTSPSQTRVDTMVRLRCSETLHSTCEDWDFDVPSFIPLALPAIQGLYSLLPSLQSLDSQTLILQTTTSIISRLDKSLPIEAANAAVTPLPHIWSNSPLTSPILRTSVLRILTLISSLASTSAVILYPIVLPMITTSLSGGVQVVHLVDDALRLWLCLMRISDNYDPSFHSLFPKVTDLIINCEWDHLRVCLMLLESYILVGGEQFLSKYSSSVCSIFCKTIGQVKTKASGYVVLGMEAALVMYPGEAGRMMVEGGVVAAILGCCGDAVREEREREPDVTLVQWMSVLARILLGARGSLDVIARSGPGGEPGFEVRAGNFLSCDDVVGLFLEKFDCVGYGGMGGSGKIHRKLWVMALCALLPRGGEPGGGCWDKAILKNLDGFVNTCVDALTDGPGDRGNMYGADYDSEEETCGGGKEQHDERLRRQREKDVVGATELGPFVRRGMDECAKYVGSGVWQEVISTVEPAILGQLMKALGS